MDLRLVIVLAPVVLALSWAIFRILPAALKQLEGFSK